jgi:hypothetical protein
MRKVHKMVLQVLEDNPSRLNEPFVRLVLTALNRLFPCPGTKAN